MTKKILVIFLSTAVWANILATNVGNSDLFTFELDLISVSIDEAENKVIF